MPHQLGNLNAAGYSGRTRRQAFRASILTAVVALSAVGAGTVAAQDQSLGALSTQSYDRAISEGRGTTARDGTANGSAGRGATGAQSQSRAQSQVQFGGANGFAGDSNDPSAMNDGANPFGRDQAADDTTRLGFATGALRPAYGFGDARNDARDGAEAEQNGETSDLLDEFDDAGNSIDPMTADGGQFGDQQTGLENIVPPQPEDGSFAALEPQVLLDGDLASYENPPVDRPTADGFGAPLSRTGAIRPLDPLSDLDPDIRDTTGPLGVLPARRTFGDAERLPSLTTDQPALDARDVLNDGLDDGQPYGPLGIRANGMVFRPMLEVDGRVTDNVRSSSGAADADLSLELRPSLNAQSDWQRHAVELEVAGERSFHKRFTSEDNIGFRSVARGRLDVFHHTAVSGEVSYDLRQESRSVVDGSAGLTGERPDLETFTTSVAIDQRINRLDLGLRASVIRFDDSVAADAGLLAFGDERDYDEYVGAGRAGFRLTPGIAVFVRGERRDRDYAIARFNDGLSRDSVEDQVLVGIEGDLRRGILTGGLAIGYGQLDPDENAFGRLDGLVFDASLTWVPTALTTVRMRAASDFEPTTLANSGGSRRQAYAIEVEHAFRRHFLMTAGLAYGIQDFEGVNLTERQMDAFVAAEYAFNREVALIARIDHTTFDSSFANRDYEANAFRVGVRLRK